MGLLMTAPAVRNTDPDTSRTAARNTAIRAGTQRHHLLAAYGTRTALEMSGLTADEAMRLVHLNPRSCYWKRVSELHAQGLLSTVDGGLFGAHLTRPGEQGADQRVLTITDLGRTTLTAITAEVVR